MSVRIRCECGALLEIKDSVAGREIHCPACRKVVVVRNTEAAEQEALYHVKEEPPLPTHPKPTIPVEPAPSPRAERPRSMKHRIIGNDLQLLEITLEPGETVIAEAGAMMYMEPEIEFTACLGDGSRPDQGFFEKLAGASRRWLSGESIFLTRFTNTGIEPRRVAFAAPYPGKIVTIDLAELGGERCVRKAPSCVPRPARDSISVPAEVGRRALRRRGLHPATDRRARAGIHPCLRRNHPARVRSRDAARAYWLPGRLLARRQL